MWTCRSRTRRRCPAPRPPRREAHAVDRAHGRLRAADDLAQRARTGSACDGREARRAQPRRRVRAARRAARRPRRRARQAERWPGRHAERRRSARSAASRERTARREAAARRRRRRSAGALDGTSIARVAHQVGEGVASGPSCRDAAARRAPRATAPISTIWPAYITADPVAGIGDHEMSCVTRIIESQAAAAARPHVEHLVLHDDVERGHRLVGDSSGGSRASAMAMAARWRMPPLNWCG